MVRSLPNIRPTEKGFVEIRRALQSLRIAIDIIDERLDAIEAALGFTGSGGLNPLMVEGGPAIEGEGGDTIYPEYFTWITWVQEGVETAEWVQDYVPGYIESESGPVLTDEDGNSIELELGTWFEYVQDTLDDHETRISALEGP